MKFRRAFWPGGLPALAGLVLAGWLAVAGGAGAAAAGEPAPAGAGGGGEPAALTRAVEEQLRASGAERLEDFYRRLAPEVRQLVPEVSLRDLVLQPGRGIRWDPGALARGVLRYFFREFFANARLLAQVVLLAVLLAVLQSLHGAFGEEGESVAFAACYLVLVLLGVQSFRHAAGIGSQAVQDMVSLMEAVLPLLSTLLVSGGTPATAALLSPVVYASVTGLSALMDTVVLPLLFLAVVLGLAAQLVEKFPLNRLSGLARQATVGVLGLAFAAFLGVMTVQGVAGPVADGVALRTGKFLAGTFVPVIGKMFSDAVEVVAGGARLIKNAVGMLGIVLLAGFAFFPVLKIVSIVAVFKVAGALVEPVADRRLPKALGHLEGSLTVLAVVVGAVGVMFFMGLTVLVQVGTLGAALR
ncbi:MAG TPA: stage III sporulation protein AE [Firmicutes bacterium]|nr:stage III sporulation protein AE [Bacillota bacterium]